MTLANRVTQADVRDLPDWQVADILNAPDPTLPEVVELRSAFAGPGTIMQALGPDAGAQLLDALESMAATVPRVRWAMHIIKGRGLDMSDPRTRAQIDGLVAAGILTVSNGQKIKAIGEVRRYPSWAEHNGVEVTARTVGLARGAKE